MTQEEKRQLFRHLIRTDLTFVCHVIGSTAILTKAHYDLVIPFVDNPEDKHLQLLAFRDFGKTTIIRAKIVQLLLQDPNRRILFVSDTKGFAVTQVRTVRNIFQRNKLLSWAFPEIIWQDMERLHIHDPGLKDESPKRWLKNEFELKRDIQVPEASLTAGTLSPMPTGGHYTHLFFDDLVTPENSETSDQVSRVVQRFNYFYSIITSPDPDIAIEGPMFVSGTIYDKDDINSLIARNEEYETLIIPCFLNRKLAKKLGREEEYMTAVENGKKLKLKEREVNVPTCPRRFPLDLLEKKRKRPGYSQYMFSCQYLLEPWDSTRALFRPEWFGQTWKELPENKKFLMVFDPAGETKTRTGEKTLLIAAVDEWLNIYFYSANRGLFTAKEIGMVIDMRRKLIRAEHGAPPEVGMEKAGLQEAFKSVIEQESDEAFIIHDLRHGNRHWFVRCLPMQTRAQNGQLYFPDPEEYPEEQWWVDDLKDQLLTTTKGQEKGERDWWDCTGYIDQMITKHHCRPPRTGDRAYTGHDGMEVDDDIIGY